MLPSAPIRMCSLRSECRFCPVRPSHPSPPGPLAIARHRDGTQTAHRLHRASSTQLSRPKRGFLRHAPSLPIFPFSHTGAIQQASENANIWSRRVFPLTPLTTSVSTTALHHFNAAMHLSSCVRKQKRSVASTKESFDTVHAGWGL